MGTAKDKKTKKESLKRDVLNDISASLVNIGVSASTHEKIVDIFKSFGFSLKKAAKEKKKSEKNKIFDGHIG